MPKKQIAQLLLFVFVDVIGYSLFFPLLPYYAAEFGAGAALVGLMIASNAAAQFLVSPVVGRLSDRYGRRPLILISIMGTLLSFLLLGLVDPISIRLANTLNISLGEPDPATRAGIWAVVLLFLCRILDGLAGGNVSLARAYVSDITTEERRAQGLGLIGAAFGFGFVVGPAIGGTLSNWPQGILWMEQANLSRFAIPAFAAVLISLVNLVGVFLFLPESLPAPERIAGLVARAKPVGFLTSLRMGQSDFKRMLGLRLLFSLAITLFMANFALYTQNHLTLSDQTTSYLLTYAGILLILVQAGGIRWLTKRYSEFKIVFYAAIVVSVSLLSLGLTSNVGSLMLVLLPLAVAGGVMNTIINSLVSKSVEKDQVGTALGLATSAESLSWVIAPVLGGALIGFLGGRAFAIVTGALAGIMIPYIGWILRSSKNSARDVI